MRYESQRPPEPPETPELAALLAAARRTGALDPGDEKRATAAFVAARDDGAHNAVVRWRRRRDDWRPAKRRRGVRSFRVMLGGLMAAATLGGVAVAAGSGAIPERFGGGESDGAESVRPPRTSPATPGGRPSSEESLQPNGDGTAPGVTNAPGDVHPSGRPDRAQGDVALCRVYLSHRGSGKAMDAAAFERLEAAAGGASEVAVTAYCEGLLGQPSPGESKKAQGNRDAKEKAEKKAQGNRDAKEKAEKKAVPEGKQGGRAPSKGSATRTGSGGKEGTAVG